MGDILFHFTPTEQAVLHAGQLNAANDNDPAYRYLRRLQTIAPPKPDNQRSRDGYGRDDWNKL